MFERNDNSWMNSIALGNKLIYDRWDLYVDLIHHALSRKDWGKNFAAIGCFNYHLTEEFNIYGKVSYEQNKSEVDLQSVNPLDCLITAGSKISKYGIGFEYNPSFCKDVRFHGVLSYCQNHREQPLVSINNSTNTFTVNFGITWHMNIHRMFMERGM